MFSKTPLKNQYFNDYFTIDANIRANIMAFSAIDAAYYFVSKTNVATEFSFNKTTRVLTLNASSGDMETEGTDYKFKLRIKYSGKYFDVSLKVPTDLKVTSGTASTVTMTISSLAIGTDGTVTIKITVAYTNAAGTASTVAEVTITGTMVDPTTGATTTGSVLLPSKVVYAGTVATPLTTELELNGTTAVTGIDWTAPVFKVYFNQAISAPTSFSIVASATSTTKKTNVTLTQTSSQISVAVDSTNSKCLVVKVTGQNTGMNTSLNPGQSYSVAVTGTVKTTDSVGTLDVTSQTYLFTTAAVKVVSFTPYYGATAGTKITDLTGAATVTASTLSKIVVDFDYPVSVPTSTELSTAYFSMAVGTTAAVQQLFKTYFSTTVTASNAGKSITISLDSKMVGKMKTGKHTIAWSSFFAKDVYGGTLDTTQTIAFTAN